jgi:AcrR family transcriptional regulator
MPKGSGHLRRSEILSAAQQIFADVGYEGATVRRIAEQVGVSSTAIYLHFPDKQAMLLEIAMETLRPVLAEAKAVAADTSLDPRERVKRMMTAYMKTGHDHPRSYGMMIGDATREMADAEGPAHELMAEYHRNFRGLVLELERQNRLKGKSAKVVSQLMWAGCHGVLALMQASPNLKWAPYEDLRDGMIDMLLTSLVD